jgi:hypothetical protein
MAEYKVVANSDQESAIKYHAAEAGVTPEEYVQNTTDRNVFGAAIDHCRAEFLGDIKTEFLKVPFAKLEGLTKAIIALCKRAQ